MGSLPRYQWFTYSMRSTVWIDMWGSPAFNAIISMKNVFDESIR